ncbi:MAG TPA: hypothetical protein V6D47_17125 [Oscillatoriaceae cyanobacterium]
MKSISKKLTVLGASAMLMAGCGYAPLPIAPTSSNYFEGPQTVQQQQLPTLPAGVTATRLTMNPATATAAVGQSLPFSITILGSDGKSYTNPQLVQWSLSNPQNGQIDINGVLQPGLPGTVQVIATLNGLTAKATVQIQEASFAWQQMMSPVHSNLHAVKVITSMDAWAGGDGGTLLRFVNGAWYTEPTFQVPDADVRGLGFVSSNLGWAVGSRAGGKTPFISRWMNGVWQTQPVPATSGVLNAISVVNDHDAWAVGQSGSSALILHWDGAKWLQWQSPCAGKLDDVQMLSADTGWAVGKGSSLTDSLPLMLKFQNGSWQKKGIIADRGAFSLTSGLEVTAIKMVSATQGYAVGISSPPLVSPRGLFLTYDPQRDGWVQGKYDSSISNLDQVPLHDIAMISGTEGWVLGETRTPDFTLSRNPQQIFGSLLDNAGGVLKADTSFFSGNMSSQYNQIDVLPTGEGFIVGDNGVIIQRTYDWRTGGNTQTINTYGYGVDPGQQTQPITYGPGGGQVPVPTPSPLLY